MTHGQAKIVARQAEALANLDAYRTKLATMFDEQMKLKMSDHSHCANQGVEELTWDRIAAMQKVALQLDLDPEGKPDDIGD